MSISEQVKELRRAGDIRLYTGGICIPEMNKLFNQAADTIESLSEKLEKANKELERWHTDKVNDKIKNPFAWTSTLCCHNCDHKDEYIEELEASDMERSAEDCGGGWIPCKDKLPEKNKMILAFLNEEAKYQIIICEYSGENYWNDGTILAWMPLPKPYHESITHG